MTPASGFVPPLGALSIGLLAGVVCYVVVCLKPFFKYDDSLDAFGVHGVGGFLGALLTGVFCVKAINAGQRRPTARLLEQFKTQGVAAVVAVGFAFVVTFVLVKAIDAIWGFCLEPQAENEGLDRNQHGEVGFDLEPGLRAGPRDAAARAAAGHGAAQRPAALHRRRRRRPAPAI